MQTQPSHHDIEELLGAYALDALEADEHELVTAHLTTCARCRAEVEQHREVAALLAHSGEPAPVGVWDKIASSLDATPPDLGLVPPPPIFTAPPKRRTGARRSLPVNRFGASLLGVAAAAVVIVLLAFQVQGLNRQVDTLERLAAGQAVDRGFESAASSADATLVELASDGTEIQTRAFLTPDSGRRAAALGRALGDYLSANDTDALFADLGDRLITGPTGNNLNDYRALVVPPRAT